MSGDDPVPVREGLERFFKHLGGPPLNVITELVEHWPDIVGPALAEPTHPLELVNGVLTVRCDDPAWASQIGWMESQIKQRFESIFPGIELKKIATRLAH